MALDHRYWDIAPANSRMFMEGCDLVQLAGEFGTPLFVVNESRLRNNCRAVVEAFAPFSRGQSVFFSYKTNPVPGILRIIHEEGLGAEIISPCELQLARHLGISSDQVVYDAIYKTAEILEELIRQEVKLINIDSANEIELLEMLAGKCGKTVEVGVRLHTSRGWGRNPFGIEDRDLLAVFSRLLAAPHLVPVGLHLHSSAWADSPRDYIHKVKQLLSIAQALKEKLRIDLKYFDVGGGYACPTVRKLGKFEELFNAAFGLNLSPPKANRHVPLARTVAALCQEVRQGCVRKGLAMPQVIIEPGMAIVADAQLLLTRVSEVKTMGGQQVIVTDSGRLNMAQPLRSEYHEVFVANRFSEPRQHCYKIFGRLCSPGDWMFQKKMLPQVSRGDLLAIMDTGAYFAAFSNSFAFPRPPIISICNGISHVLRRGECFDDIIHLDEHV